jgi:hypothetical protein
MEFKFHDVMESKYRVDFFIVKTFDLAKMQTRLNQWITAQTLVMYKTSIIGDSILFEVVRMKGDE